MRNGFGVRHEYGLLRDDQRTQRASGSIEEGAVTNMGSGSTPGRGYVDLTWVGLSSDPSLLLRMTMRRGGWRCELDCEEDHESGARTL